MTGPNVLGIVSYKVFPAQMGGQKCVAEFYTHLAEYTTVTLVASRENTAGTDTAYEIFPFLYNHWQGMANILYLYKLKKLIREKAIDVIIIEHSYFGWLGLLLRWLTKKPVIIRSHNIEALRFRDMQRYWWPLYEWYEKKVHRKMNHNFFITEEDRNWALKHWRLEEKKCSVITYGTVITQPPAQEQRKISRERLLNMYGLSASTRLFLFNGSLDYIPNTDALRIIISELIPRLQSLPFSYCLFICGKELNKQWEKALSAFPEIMYTGFVKDITLYFQGTDCFINPITLGGGIRIKLVEALAHNQTVISTQTGARGIAPGLTADKLVLTEDYDWSSFAKNMAAQHFRPHTNIPPAFYDEFNWDRIVQKALLSLQTL